MLDESCSGQGFLTHEKRDPSTIRWGSPTVRDLMSRSRETVRGLVYDSRSRRFIASESEIERRLILCALHWQTVERVTEQPFVLTFQSPPLRYTPDFCLEFLSGQRQIVEIKPATQVDTDESLRARLTRIAYALNDHGLMFSVVTERDFSKRFHISNLRLLKPYLNYKTQGVLNAFNSITYCCPSNFEELSSAVTCPHIALALIAQKYLYADLSTPICNDTSINAKGENHEPPYFESWHPTDNSWEAMEDREYS